MYDKKVVPLRPICFDDHNLKRTIVKLKPEAVRVVSTRPLFYVLKHILGQKIRKNAKKNAKK